MLELTEGKGTTDRSFITALARGLQLLECLARTGRSLTLTELSRLLGLNKVTTSRFCHTLTELGYIERTSAKRYQLTPKVLTLGYALVCGYDLTRMAEPYLRELSRQLSETVNMAVLDKAEIVYVARFKTEQILSSELYIGSKLPAFCTSMGKSMLAHLPEAECDALLDRVEFVRLTYRTVDSRETLAAELKRIRQQGYAINNEELSVGLRSIAAPILRDGLPVAAINIAVPTTRYSVETLVSQLVDPLLRTAQTISGLLQQQVGILRVS